MQTKLRNIEKVRFGIRGTSNTFSGSGWKSLIQWPCGFFLIIQFIEWGFWSPISVITGFLIPLTVGDILGVGPPSAAAVPILVVQDVVTEPGKQPNKCIMLDNFPMVKGSRGTLYTTIFKYASFIFRSILK
jgi:hypothetical protein